MTIASNRLKGLSDNKRHGNEWGRYRIEYVFYYFLTVCEAAHRATGYLMPEQEAIDNERVSIKYSTFA